MEYAKLGNTDIEVSKVCVGCMSFGKPEQCTTGQDRLMGKKAAQRRFLLLLMDRKCIRKIDFIFV